MNLLFFLKPKQEVCTLHKNFTLRQGVEKLRQGGFSSVPVIDEEGKYCGTVSEGDFLRKILDCGGDVKSWEQIPLTDILSRQYKAVNVTTDLEGLLKYATNQNFVPVTDDRGMFIGIVTRQDIIRYFAQEFQQLEKSSALHTFCPLCSMTRKPGGFPGIFMPFSRPDPLVDGPCPLRYNKIHERYRNRYFVYGARCATQTLYPQ